MEISYRTTKLEKLLTNDLKLIKKYGIQAANMIIQRMQELDAVETLDDMPPAARTHQYEPKDNGKFSVDILKHKHPLRLLFYAIGGFELSDKSTIKEIQIDEIVKIHS